MNANREPNPREGRGGGGGAVGGSGNVAPPNNKPWNPMGEIKLQPERIAATSPDQVLVIDAWDQS